VLVPAQLAGQAQDRLERLVSSGLERERATPVLKEIEQTIAASKPFLELAQRLDRLQVADGLPLEQP
jgi:hypothetical protein